MTYQASQDKKFMSIALRLARRGAGRVLPNPLVGAVVVRDGKIIGQGYHKMFGGPHAEVFALQQAGEKAKGATLYVTLEPCCHFAKTPPCTQMILRADLRRVVIAMPDPNPRVHGRGIEQLRKGGLTVDVGVLAEKAQQMNAPFTKYIKSHIPYVTLKIAQTLDGKIADQDQKAKWISGKAARTRVHRWRWHAGAVLVGIGTVVKDDPALTIRHVRGLQPWRLILDSQLRIPLNAKVLNDEFLAKTVIFTRDDRLEPRKVDEIEKRGVQIIPVKGDLKQSVSLREVLKAAAGMKIAHVFVEGGGRIFTSFIREKLADHLALFIAPKLFGKGVDGLKFSNYNVTNPLLLKNVHWRKVGEDMLFEGDFMWR